MLMWLSVPYARHPLLISAHATGAPGIPSQMGRPWENQQTVFQPDVCHKCVIGPEPWTLPFCRLASCRAAPPPRCCRQSRRAAPRPSSSRAPRRRPLRCDARPSAMVWGQMWSARRPSLLPVPSLACNTTTATSRRCQGAIPPIFGATAGLVYFACGGQVSNCHLRVQLPDSAPS